MKAKKLTDHLLSRHRDKILAGETQEKLAESLDVRLRTVQRWLQRGKTAEDLHPTELTEHDFRCIKFRALYERGLAKLEHSHLEIIAEAGKTDWRASSSFLQKRFPLKYSPRGIKIRTMVEAADPDIFTLEGEELDAKIQLRARQLILAALTAGDLETALKIHEVSETADAVLQQEERLLRREAVAQAFLQHVKETTHDGEEKQPDAPGGGNGT